MPIIGSRGKECQPNEGSTPIQDIDRGTKKADSKEISKNNFHFWRELCIIVPQSPVKLPIQERRNNKGHPFRDGFYYVWTYEY